MTQLEQHTVHAYDRDLAAVTSGILRMGELAHEMIAIVGKSIAHPSEEQVALAIATDNKINALDIEIEQQTTSMMALRQPMGIDLRLLTSALKSAVILERMGDLAKNTVKRSTHFTAPLDAETAAKLQQMLQIITSMLTETMQAFASHDEKKVFTVYGKDSEVDAIYYDLISTLEEQMRHNSAQVSSYMQVIFAVKNIERFGDYVTKLARMVYYIVSGVRPPKG